MNQARGKRNAGKGTVLEARHYNQLNVGCVGKKKPTIISNNVIVEPSSHCVPGTILIALNKNSLCFSELPYLVLLSLSLFQREGGYITTVR